MPILLLSILALLLNACATPAIGPSNSPSPQPVPKPATVAAPKTHSAPISSSTPRPNVVALPTPPVPVSSKPIASAPISTVSPSSDARTLILRYLPTQISDRNGWANDMASAFSALRLVPSPEFICSAIAVIEQESSFQADPEVPGLSRIVWQEIEQRRRKYFIPETLVNAALSKNSPNGRSYKYRIDNLRTEQQMNALYQDMITELPFGKDLLGPYNPVRTGGPMQVSVAFAEEHTRQKGYPYATGRLIRDEVFTRRGGLYFGIAILLDYPAPYSHPQYRFADFNAGRFASRNAAFQSAVARLSRSRLDLDGDLLIYDKGQISTQVSATQDALDKIAATLKLSRADIRRDLTLEKSAQFSDTPLYRAVFAAASQQNKNTPRETMPRIVLKSPKITRKLTTAWFSERVYGRYQSCLNRGQSTN